MGEYAPEAIRWLAKQILAAVPKSKLSGIVGDSAHVYGYHRARSRLPASDYSVQLAEDRAGDADAASALDISLDPAGMKLVTGRLMKSAKDKEDPRLDVLREFYGTLDGKKVAGWDTHYGKSATSDSSHLWHVHLSIKRKYATDKAALAKVLSVIIGEDNDDVSAKDVWTYDPNKLGAGGVANLSGRHDSETNLTVTPAWALHSAWGEARTAAQAAAKALEELAAAKERETQILAAVADLQANQAETTELLRRLLERPAEVATEAVAEGLRTAADRVDPPTP